MLFTRCPDCETTFRITAEALRKADGQVRCGRCARVFNAYNELRRRARKRNAAKREDPPPASVEAPAPQQGASDAAAGAAPPKPGTAAVGSESGTAPARPDDASTAETARTEPGEAEAARAEPAEAEATRTEPAEAAAPRDAEDAPAAPAAQSDAGDPRPRSSVPAATTAEPSKARANAGPLAPSPTSPEASPSAESRPAPAAAAKAADAEKDVVVGDISLAGVIAELEASAAPDDAEPLDAAKPEVATGIPATVGLLGKNGLSKAAAAPAGAGIEAAAADGDTLAAPAWVILDEAPAKRGVGARTWMYGSIAAGVLLALQVLHHYRSELAVTAVVGPAVRATYSMLGVEILPDWDLDQYELVVDWDAVTQPNADEHGNLTIAARIRNRGPGDLPLPHVQVQLKDRWEATLGSRVFAPAEYLPPGAAVHRSMIAGQIALAELAILDPGPQAYGFELDVCVGSEAGGLRCAADEVFR